jgi:hypothetical protein
MQKGLDFDQKLNVGSTQGFMQATSKSKFAATGLTEAQN